MERIQIKDVVGYEGYYKVTSDGRIISCERTVINRGATYKTKERIRKQVVHKNGYAQVMFSVNGKHKLELVHRIVAKAFVDNPNNKLEVNHIDCNKLNNCASNLEWNTRQENNNHSWENDLPRHGERASKKLTQSQVDDIRLNYKKRSKSFGIKHFSEKYNISTTYVFNIVNNNRWKQ